MVASPSPSKNILVEVLKVKSSPGKVYNPRPTGQRRERWACQTTPGQLDGERRDGRAAYLRTNILCSAHKAAAPRPQALPLPVLYSSILLFHLVQHLGRAKVRHQDVHAGAQQDVLWLQVSVHYFQTVEVVQRLHQLSGVELGHINFSGSHPLDKPSHNCHLLVIVEIYELREKI